MNESSVLFNLSKLVPGMNWYETADRGHLVQLYEDDEFLVGVVAQFVGLALESDRGGIVVATALHLGRIEERLRARGIDIAAATARGQYVAHDATALLASFSVNGWPQKERFFEIVGGVVGRMASRYPRIRIFGEMVALQWARGDYDAAVELEKFWNELAQKHAFALCCAYPLSAFAGNAPDQRFLDVCGKHSHVVPAESYLSLVTSEERLRMVAHMQQKMAAFEQREKELFSLQDQAKGQYWIGVDGKILWANRAELDLFGYAYDQYVGRTLEDFCADRDAARGILQRLTRGETLYSYPVNRRCKDGSTRRVLMYSGTLWKWGELTYARCFTREAA